MTRNYDTTTHKLFPRVSEIKLTYPANGAPQAVYTECMAVVDGDGVVRHTNDYMTENILQLSSITEPVQCVRPDTGADIPGMTATQQQLMLMLLAFIRADQKRRDAEQDAATAA